MKRQKREIIEQSTGNMVTIDEILKDDPKALEELKKMRKWMDENPSLFQFPEEKVTQGQKKSKQLLEDARRNSKFIRKLALVANTKPSYEPKQLAMVHSLYLLFLNELQLFRKKYVLNDLGYKLRKSLCKEYGIDPILFNRLISDFKNGLIEGWDFSESTNGDMCILEDQEESGPENMHTFHLMTVDQIEKEVYPIKIKIHRFASKRDILDFVEKNWKMMTPHLKDKRIKSRKISRQVLDFIWKNRDKKAKDIKVLLDQKFPKNGLVYFEIGKILSDEKKRRFAK